MQADKIQTPTVKEFLSMQDWVFDPRINQGEHGDFHWLQCSVLGNFGPFDRIESPSVPFCLVVKPHILGGPDVSSIGQRKGWKTVGSFAFSNWNDTMPEISFDRLGTVFVIDEMKSDLEIAEALIDFEDVFFVSPGITEKFLRVLDQLRPYYCVSGSMFAARGKDVYQQFYNEDWLEEIRRWEWRYTLEHRQSFWKGQGPECGPETCVEPGCDRLRIRLAVRCFVHHAMGLWVPGHGLD